MNPPTVIAWDSETYRIGPGSLAPKMVCATFAYRDSEGEVDRLLLGNHPGDGLEARLKWMLTDPNLIVVTHNGGFDHAVICVSYPQLIPLVFAALQSGRFTDTLWREKLLNLSTSGRLKNLPLPDGTSKRLSYSLATLETDYLGIDRSEMKGNLDETWRANYSMLDGWRTEDYPEDAAGYALDDAEGTLCVYEAQERRRIADGASVATEEFQLLKSFVLMLMTAWGMKVNHEETDLLEEAVLKVMDETKGLLESSGLLRPDTLIGPPMKKHLELAYDALAMHFTDVPAEIEDEDWGPYQEKLESLGVKFKKPTAKPGSMNQKKFQAHLAALYKQLGEIPNMTAGGEKKAPAIQCDGEVREYLATKCPVMKQYDDRKAFAKIVTGTIPALRSGDVIHASYNALVETGRTSSFDGGLWTIPGQGEVRVFPSWNAQNVPNSIRELDSRRCVEPRPGTAYIDSDYVALELACVGQVTHDLFESSIHFDLYNQGVDLHAYLGAHLALNSPLDTHPLLGDFQGAVREEGIGSNPMALYEAFKLLKVHDDEDVRKFFKHFRNFAKPVGLGFPGGLGAATMVDFARKTYKVILTEEQAKAFKAFWLDTYPEMVKFFEWINCQVDEYNLSDDTLYAYTTAMGMVRRGASFCAAANGASMQSPGAEAAMSGTILVSQACYDVTQESVLYGCRPVNFIHDQDLVETTKDQSLWHDQCSEVGRLMRIGAELALPGMKMRTEELLTPVWSKGAEPTFDENDRHILWTPR